MASGEALGVLVEGTRANHATKPTVSNFSLTLAEATAAVQRTAAALMAAHSAGNRCLEVAMSTVGDSPKPAPTAASKGGVSFVIPKNKLSGALVPVAQNVGEKVEAGIEVKKEEIERKKPRKTRWGPDLREDPAVRRGLALALQTRAEQIAAQLESGFLEIDTNEVTRSPSPPPIYDANGQRTNTREGRRREQLELERREAIGECMLLNPSYKPPAGYKPVYKEAKLFIPVKDYPGYNFIGLILGPRGNTQKRMELETGSKIAIRGKGAVKEGKQRPVQVGRRDKDAEGAFDDLHVHITADTIEKVDAAVALIEPLLTPVDEVRNTHKRKQLRELAEMNGTMRDFTKPCTICGETGHREWQCSKDKLMTFQAKVSCTICGDGGHPTIDCPQKPSELTAVQGAVLDKEYLNFLNELNDGLAGVGATPSSVVVTAKAEAEPPRTVQIRRATAAPAFGIRPEGPVSNPQLRPQLNQAVGSQPMLITTSGPQPIPAAWSGPPQASYDGRASNMEVRYSGGQTGNVMTAAPAVPGGYTSYPGSYAPRPVNPGYTGPPVVRPGYTVVRHLVPVSNVMYPPDTRPPMNSTLTGAQSQIAAYGKDPADPNRQIVEQNRAFPSYGPSGGVQQQARVVVSGTPHGTCPPSPFQQGGTPVAASNAAGSQPVGGSTQPVQGAGGMTHSWDVNKRASQTPSTSPVWQVSPQPNAPPVWHQRPPIWPPQAPTQAHTTSTASTQGAPAPPTPPPPVSAPHSIPQPSWHAGATAAPSTRPWPPMAPGQSLHPVAVTYQPAGSPGYGSPWRSPRPPPPRAVTPTPPPPPLPPGLPPSWTSAPPTMTWPMRPPQPSSGTVATQSYHQCMHPAPPSAAVMQSSNLQAQGDSRPPASGDFGQATAGRELVGSTVGGPASNLPWQQPPLPIQPGSSAVPPQPPSSAQVLDAEYEKLMASVGVT